MRSASPHPKASGLRQNFGTDVKPLHAALAARAGLFSARLAQSGFTANPAIPRRPPWLPRRLSRGRPPRRWMRSSPCSHQAALFENPLKPASPSSRTPCCGCTHSALDALFDLMAEHRIQAAAGCKHIECKVNHRAPEVLIHHLASTARSRASSALSIVSLFPCSTGSPGCSSSTQRRVDDPAVQAMLRRVQMTVDPTLPVMEGAFPSEVAPCISTTAGVVARRVFEARGHRTRALSL